MTEDPNKYERQIPDYPVPDGSSQIEFLRQLCTEALVIRNCNDAAHRERLERELQRTAERGYANYFLLLWDLVKEVRRNGGLVASCGAIESSLINYLLDIATFDPVEFGVTERFIDVYDDFGGGLTFDTGGHRHAIDYVTKRYGNDFLYYDTIWGPTIVSLQAENIMNLIKDVTEECNIDYLTISLDDKKTFALFSECKMEEFYGFGNKKTRAILSDLQPVTFRELILSDNLFCLSENKCKEFLSRYHEKTEVSFPLPGISDILKDTYGVVVYVEQLEQIFHRVAGFTSDEIEHIINKGLSNKEFLEMKQLFIKRGIANGYSECKLERFWDEENSSGDFVYPHCDRYLWLPESLSSTYLAYISTYLKAHFPETYQNHRKNILTIYRLLCNKQINVLFYGEYRFSRFGKDSYKPGMENHRPVSGTMGCMLLQ